MTLSQTLDSSAHSPMPKKSLGQHFLTSTYHARRIAESVPAAPGETVLELCSGRGALSRYLVSRFPSLHCNEMDRDVMPQLRSTLGEGPWTLHEGNVLELDFRTIGTALHVVGNLPYNIGAIIIRKTLLYGSMIRSCTFMVQREVAERIVAAPHSKKNGFLSIFCQFFGTPRILFHVPPGAFFPKPRVDSSVFQILVERPPEKRLPSAQWEDFFRFVDRGFSKRRKTLVNALGWDGDKDHYITILKQMQLPLAVRPEDLGINEWMELYTRSCAP
jgi:16S rRNA (adenine1518-N6/adenine1519-N6)-dimethyltransferase